MRKILKLEPDGFPYTFSDCPPGFFLSGESVCLKTEYSDEKDGKYFDRAYCDSGEAYWGGTSVLAERAKKEVQPLKVVWAEEEV